MFKVDYEKKQNVIIARFNGELFVEDVDRLKSQFNEYKNSNKFFLFDLSGLMMIDSSGLGYIVSCLKTTRDMQGDLKIVGLHTQAKLIFEITRVDSIIDIFEDENEAMQSFEQMETGHESDNSYRIEITA